MRAKLKNWKIYFFSILLGFSSFSKWNFGIFFLFSLYPTINLILIKLLGLVYDEMTGKKKVNLGKSLFKFVMKL